MAFDKFITIDQKLTLMGAKLDGIISDLDAMLLKKDLDTPFGTLDTPQSTPQEATDDPS